MIEVHSEFPQREVIQANAVVDNEEKTISEVIISAKPEITGVTASVDNETGTPYVEATETGTGTEFSFDLAFHNLKGDKGEQGEQGEPGQNGQDGTDGQDGFSPTATVEPIQGGAKITITDKDGTTTTNVYNGTDGTDGADGQNAEITGATASVTNTTGTPSVTVTSGGTSLARTFDFAFTNLKGDTGATGQDGQDGASAEITGVTASVDSNVGTPSVAVTMGGTSLARTFDFAFHNLKGADGTGAVTDVQVNGTSVLSSGIANILMAAVASSGNYSDLLNKPIPPIAFGTSTTAAATAEKVVSIPEITTLNAGQIIVVQPTKSSTVADSTIKLNNFTAYPMKYAGNAITTSTDNVVWNANQPSAFVFDGSNWLFLCHGLDSNTTYSSMSVAEGTTGTATSTRSLTATNLKQIIQETTLTGLDTTTNTAVVDTDTITEGIGKLQAQSTNKANTDLTNTTPSSSFIDNMFVQCSPDYEAGVSKSSSGFTADEDGWLMAWGSVQPSSDATKRSSTFNINNTYFSLAYTGGTSGNLMSSGYRLFPILNGDVVTVGSVGNAINFTFFPLKGAN